MSAGLIAEASYLVNVALECAGVFVRHVCFSSALMNLGTQYVDIRVGLCKENCFLVREFGEGTKAVWYEEMWPSVRVFMSRGVHIPMTSWATNRVAGVCSFGAHYERGTTSKSSFSGHMVDLVVWIRLATCTEQP